jgi:hypothetical protein
MEVLAIKYVKFPDNKSGVRSDTEGEFEETKKKLHAKACNLLFSY